jgi:ABC-type taurine transport system ATPase subunit
LETTKNQGITISARSRERGLRAQGCGLFPVENLWVNLDFGLKARGWTEVKPSLANMVEAARELRQRAVLAGEAQPSSSTI